MTFRWTDKFEAAVGSEHPEWTVGDRAQFAFSVNQINLKSGDSIRLRKSGVTAIVGANNAGKSTILRELYEKLSHQSNTPPPQAMSVESVLATKSGTTGDLFDWLGSNSSFITSNGNVGFQRPNASWCSVRSLARSWNMGSDLGLSASFYCFYGNAQGRFSIGGAVEMRETSGDPPTHPVHSLQDSKDLFNEVSRIAKETFGQPLTLDTLARTVRLRVGVIDEPAPRIDQITESFRSAMIALKPLDEQGDGMRSLFGQLLPVIAGSQPLVIIDEPEAFLHPPQAHALGVELGRIAIKRGIQILIATHDKNLLTGLLQSQVDVSVVRLTRDEGPVRAHQLDPDELRALWSDSVLKYTNVLDGLFHRLVVLAEAEGDCAYLAAALDHYTDENQSIPRNEVLFVPTGGKDGMAKVARALQAVLVPVVAAPDMDLLNDEAKLSALVEAVGGSWTPALRTYWRQATVDIRAKKEPAKVGHILSAINSALQENTDEHYSDKHRKAVQAQLRLGTTPWEVVKEYGLNAFRGSAWADANSLLDGLDAAGVVLVREGELERMAPEVATRKGAGWLQAALESGAHSNSRTQGHIARIMNAGERLVNVP